MKYLTVLVSEQINKSLAEVFACHCFVHVPFQSIVHWLTTAIFTLDGIALCPLFRLTGGKSSKSQKYLASPLPIQEQWKT